MRTKSPVAVILVAFFLLALLVTQASAAGRLNTGLVYDPDYLLHDAGSGHPERPERLETIMSHLEKQELLKSLHRIPARIISDRWLLETHAEQYLKDLEAASRDAPFQLDPDTRMSSKSLRVAKLAAGGVLAAVDAVMTGQVKNAFAAVRPPGHHALRERAMGFCLFNNVAVAARYVQKRYGLKRVLIVDWDVHHGNGTQEIFYNDASVLYFSTHQYPYYPGTGSSKETGSGSGVGTTLNVPLVAGAGDAEVIDVFKKQLVPAVAKFQPQFVFVSAGFDAHRDDPLAQLDFTEKGYRQLTRIVVEIAGKYAEGRLVSVLEGGYNLNALSRSVAAHLQVLMVE
ncbi:histone deacetylase [Pseudomonadota bacterium]